MSRQQPLYRLPGETRGARAVVRRLIVLGALGLTVLSWILTQLVARRLGQAPALGEGWFSLSATTFTWLVLVVAATFTASLMLLVQGGARRLGWALLGLALMLAGFALTVRDGPIHPPFQILVWWRDFGDMPAVAAVLAPYLAVLRAVAIGLAVVTLIAAVLASGRRDRHDVHGSAHWAAHRDVKRAGLLNDGGLLLGLWRQGGRTRYLRHDGPEHVFVFAPTRTGKGVGLVLPNLLSWPHSVLVHDIKGEPRRFLVALTAGWRSKELGMEHSRKRTSPIPLVDPLWRPERGA